MKKSSKYFMPLWKAKMSLSRTSRKRSEMTIDLRGCSSFLRIAVIRIYEISLSYKKQWQRRRLKSRSISKLLRKIRDSLRIAFKWGINDQ